MVAVRLGLCLAFTVPGSAATTADTSRPPSIAPGDLKQFQLVILVIEGRLCCVFCIVGRGRVACSVLL
jgi:hypothetical protein